MRIVRRRMLEELEAISLTLIEAREHAFVKKLLDAVRLRHGFRVHRVED